MSDDRLAENRKKLEMRSWFLRGSLAFNIAIVAGLVVNYLGRCA